MRLGLTPSLSFQLQQARQNAGIREQLQQVSQEAVSGRRADPLAATNGRLGDALMIQNELGAIERHRQAAGLAGARLDGAANAIALVRETLVGFAPEARAALGTIDQDDAPLEAVRARAEGIVLQVASTFNQRQGERYLFGGNQTGAAPLSSLDQLLGDVRTEIGAATDPADATARIDTYFNDPAGGFAQDIYQGSDADGPRLHVTDSQSLNPLPKADDPVFKSILQGLAMISESDASNTPEDNQALINAGLDLLDSGLENLLRIEARLGASSQTVDQIDQALQTEAQLLSASENRLLGRDTFEAAAELQALEGQLQASYTITGRLGSLNLTNFLR